MRRIRLARFLFFLSRFLPGKYPLQAEPPLDPQPFFVLGSGRNGSTLLNRMLNQHSALFLPSEQYFLGNSIFKFRLYHFLIWRDLMKVIAGELLPATETTTWNMDVNELIMPLMTLQDQSLQRVIDGIFREYGHQLGSEFLRWGDTTPLNTQYLPEIFSLFPKAKYLFLIRDGRDVVTSYHAAGAEYLGKYADPEEAARLWQRAVRRYEWLLKKVKATTGGEVLLVRYEDLVTFPEAALSRVCDFLELSFEPQMLHFYEKDPGSSMYQEPQHQNIRNPVSSDSIGKWQAVFSGNESFFTLIEKDLIKYGYL